MVRLDRATPLVPLNVQREGLEGVRKGKGGEIAEWLAGVGGLGGTRVGAIETTGVGPVSNNVELFAGSVPERFRSYLEPKINEGGRNLDTEVRNAIRKSNENARKAPGGLVPNASQENAVAWALPPKVSLIRGPPGTG